MVPPCILSPLKEQLSRLLSVDVLVDGVTQQPMRGSLALLRKALHALAHIAIQPYRHTTHWHA